jgi:hypothetical protein
MEASEDPFAELGMLVEALSEMAKPYGYVVETLSDPDMMPALALVIRKPGGEWLASMCAVVEGDGFSFPDEKSKAAALVSRYGSRPEWDAYFFYSWETLRFPGGSPEELALKAAAGIKAALYMR